MDRTFIIEELIFKASHTLLNKEEGIALVQALVACIKFVNIHDDYKDVITDFSNRLNKNKTALRNFSGSEKNQDNLDAVFQLMLEIEKGRQIFVNKLTAFMSACAFLSYTKDEMITEARKKFSKDDLDILLDEMKG